MNVMKTDPNDLIVVCGGGGFIGGHLVADLLSQGHGKIVSSTSSRSRSGINSSRRLRT